MNMYLLLSFVGVKERRTHYWKRHVLLFSLFLWEAGLLYCFGIGGHESGVVT